MRLLLIAPDDLTSEKLAEQLRSGGFIPQTIACVRDALDRHLYEGVSAIIVDCRMEPERALAATRALRAGGAQQPLFLLAARGDWRDKIACLDAGADDYVLQPVRTEEIAARLRAVIRRGVGEPTNQIVIGNIQLDLKARCAWRDGKCLSLTRNEFRLLRLFMFNPDRPLSHAQIIEQFNPDGKRVSSNALEVLIGRLRRKIGADYILTLRGVGYRFNVPTKGQPPVAPEDCRLAPCHAKHYKKF